MSLTHGTIRLNSSDLNACCTGDLSVNSMHSSTSKSSVSQTSSARNLLFIR